MVASCQHGIWKSCAIIGRGHSASEACRILIDLALERGSCDNLSIQVAKVLELGHAHETHDEQRKGLLKRALRFLGSQESPAGK